MKFRSVIFGSLILCSAVIYGSTCLAEEQVWGEGLINSHSSEQLASSRLIVKLKEPSPLRAMANKEEAISIFCEENNVKLLQILDQVDLFIVEPRSGSPEDMMEVLQRNENVKYVELDQLITIDQIPNDPAFSQLWGLANTGQKGGVVDADIDAPEAWDTLTGNSSVVVAVIDTGVDYNHTDLAANMWVNPGEIPGNNIDDDGNGYVDDVHGINAITGSGDPMDDAQHGTHCAGVIGGVGNNQIGVVGVSWNVKIMALKFLSSSGGGYTSDAVKCLDYAIKMKQTYGVNVRLTSNSWGGGGYSQAMYDSILASKNANMIFIAAAGNDGTNNDYGPHYPSNYDLDNVISVASITRYDQLSSFSNYGSTSVDLAAPGSYIYSTVPGNGYTTMSGTSMATPYVSGAASLVLAAQPNFTYFQLRNALLQGVVQTTALSGKVQTGGRLNVNNSIQGAPAPPPVPILDHFVSTGSWTGAGNGSDGWYVGDFNGDGRDDIFRYVPGSCGAEVFLSTGNSFTLAGCWSGSGNGASGWYVNDYNKDGKDDIFRYVPGSCGAEVFLSTGSSFEIAGCWSGAGSGIGNKWYIGDFDGDGKSDIFRYVPGRSGAEVFINEY